VNATVARQRAVQAAMLGYTHRPSIYYTQGGSRWQGIQSRLNASAGRYPRWCDCSSFVTWCLWNGLYLGFGVGDVVNGCGWRAGFTGTMLNHGSRVSAASALPGDAVIYGRGFPGSHAAIVVKSGSRPMVVSMGSNSGPLYLPYNYRGDVMSVRRYISGPSAPAGPRTLHQGMRGSDVGQIQIWLLRGGYLRKGDPKRHIPPAIDNEFGPATKSAVQKFQRDNRLTADGVVGNKTRDALRKKYRR